MSNRERYRPSLGRVVIWVVLLGVAAYVANVVLFDESGPTPVQIEPEK